MALLRASRRGDDLTQCTKANKVHKLQYGTPNCVYWHSKHSIRLSTLHLNSSFAHNDRVFLLLAVANVTPANIVEKYSAKVHNELV